MALDVATHQVTSIGKMSSAWKRQKSCEAGLGAPNGSMDGVDTSSKHKHLQLHIHIVDFKQGRNGYVDIEIENIF